MSLGNIVHPLTDWVFGVDFSDNEACLNVDANTDVPELEDLYGKSGVLRQIGSPSVTPPFWKTQNNGGSCNYNNTTDQLNNLIATFSSAQAVAPPYTMVSIATRAFTVGNGVSKVLIDASSGGLQFGYRRTAGGVLKLRLFNGTALEVNAGTVAGTRGHILIVDGTSSKIIEDGTTLVTGNAGTNDVWLGGSSGFTGVVFGGFSGTNSWGGVSAVLQANMAEWYIFDRAFSADEIDLWSAYQKTLIDVRTLSTITT